MALSNVKDMCFVDYSSLCEASPADMKVLNSEELDSGFGSVVGQIVGIINKAAAIFSVSQVYDYQYPELPLDDNEIKFADDPTPVDDFLSPDDGMDYGNGASAFVDEEGIEPEATEEWSFKLVAEMNFGSLQDFDIKEILAYIADSLQSAKASFQSLVAPNIENDFEYPVETDDTTNDYNMGVESEMQFQASRDVVLSSHRVLLSEEDLEDNDMAVDSSAVLFDLDEEELTSRDEEDETENRYRSNEDEEFSVLSEWGIHADTPAAVGPKPHSFDFAEMKNWFWIEDDTSSSQSHAGDEEEFVSPLGFGVTGDTCLYENYQLLSGDCQQAIGDVYSLHDQYIAEDDSSHHHPHVFGLILLVGVALICCVKGRARRQKIAAVLEAIRQDPELKARVEAATGQPIPERCSKPRSGNCFAWRVTFCLALLFAAIRVTGCIYGTMVRKDEHGDESSPGILIYCLLLIAVTTIFAVLTAAFYWVCKQVCGGSCVISAFLPGSARNHVGEWSLYAPLMTDEGDLELRANAHQPNRTVSEVYVVPAQTYSNVSMV